jgi:hypothetical protein
LQNDFQTTIGVDYVEAYRFPQTLFAHRNAIQIKINKETIPSAVVVFSVSTLSLSNQHCGKLKFKNPLKVIRNNGKHKVIRKPF